MPELTVLSKMAGRCPMACRRIDHTHLYARADSSIQDGGEVSQGVHRRIDHTHLYAMPELSVPSKMAGRCLRAHTGG